ncbi:MAG: dynamin family protein [Acidimicrobiales bacterium]|jgi:hypothetical protein|nr:dynamin family protein [Acidimicrobiales bacterium]
MAQAREPTDALDEAERLLGLAVAAVAAYGRDDLASIPAAALERLRTPDNTVVVLGEFKQGKSSLVNALLGTTVCGVDDDIATAVPTLLRYGDPPSAAAVHVDDTHTEQIREPLTIDAVSGIVLDPACDPHGPPRPSWVEVSLPRKLLGAGMAVIDTPGLGGLPSAHGAAALATLRGADGVLFVSDASQELTATELDYLALALARCPTAAVVEPKIDISPAWREIVEADRVHLADRGIDVPVFGVSSPLRVTATSDGDRELNEESGFPRLAAFLRDGIQVQAAARRATGAAEAVITTARRLREPFTAEHAALADPSRRAELFVRLEEAQHRTDELRSRSARWQQVLGDAIQDLVADVDHDLRERLRQLNREFDDRIDAGQPIAEWDELAADVQERVTAAVVANYDLLAARTDEVACDVAALFVESADPRTGSAVQTPIDVLAALGLDARPDPEGSRLSRVGSSLLTGARGAYGQLMMFSMAASMIGISLLNPLTFLVTIGMGRKAIRDERKRRLAQQRQQAKLAVHRYIDDVAFAVGKDSRDALRRVQRTLRDDLSELAEQAHASAAQALQAARAAAEQPDVTRRLADVEAELARLDALEERAHDLLRAVGREEAP